MQMAALLSYVPENNSILTSNYRALHFAPVSNLEFGRSYYMAAGGVSVASRTRSSIAATSPSS